jgi:type IV pilus assembly protein PilV
MTLVEVLVTMTIMSVGLLGVAALQMSTLRNNYNAYSRSQAAVLAGDILDRMRANLDAARAGKYVVPVGPYSGSGTPAAADLVAWKMTLAAQLPRGDGSVQTITTDPTTGLVHVVEVAIRWQERVEKEEQGEGVTLTFVTRSRL